MKFDHDASWNNFLAVFNERLPIREGWNSIIDFHEKIVSRPFWSELRNLNVEEEQENIKNWMEQLVTRDPIPATVKALWMGFVKLEDEENSSSVISLVGCDDYDWEDLEWTAEISYEPENRYGVLEVLNQIDKLTNAGDEEEHEFLDWILPLAYCALTLDEIIRTKLDPALFLRSQKKIFVSTGHEDGDYKNLSQIRAEKTIVNS